VSQQPLDCFPFSTHSSQCWWSSHLERAIAIDACHDFYEHAHNFLPTGLNPKVNTKRDHPHEADYERGTFHFHGASFVIDQMGGLSDSKSDMVFDFFFSSPALASSLGAVY